MVSRKKLQPNRGGRKWHRRPVTPEWVDAPPEVTLNMVPGLFHRREIPDNFVNEGSVIRDPLGLYPL